MLTAFILKRRVKKRRLIRRSIRRVKHCSVYVYSFFADMSYHPAGKLSFSVVIVLVAFGFKRFRFFLQNLFSFYFATFLMGGGIIGAHSLLETDSIMENGVLMTNWSGFGDPVSWLFIVWGFAAVWLFSKKGFEDIEAKNIQYEERVRLRQIGHHTLHFRGLIDSGNQLYDPITKTPVMIINIEKLKVDIRNSRNDDHQRQTRLKPSGSSMKHFRYFGQNALDSIQGSRPSESVFIMLKPDHVNDYVRKEEMIAAMKCLIGISTTQLSADGEFDAIIHPKMLFGQACQTRFIIFANVRYIIILQTA